MQLHLHIRNGRIDFQNAHEHINSTYPIKNILANNLATRTMQYYSFVISARENLVSAHTHTQNTQHWHTLCVFFLFVFLLFAYFTFPMFNWACFGQIADLWTLFFHFISNTAVCHYFFCCCTHSFWVLRWSTNTNNRVQCIGLLSFLSVEFDWRVCSLCVRGQWINVWLKRILCTIGNVSIHLPMEVEIIPSWPTK